jgi:hypothetical protein
LAAGLFLGLTAEEFWKLTPRHWDAVWNQYVDSEERSDRRIGMLYTMYYNAHRAEHSPVRTLDELFPRRHSKLVQQVTASGKALRDPMEQLAMAKEFTKAFHGGHR